MVILHINFFWAHWPDPTPKCQVQLHMLGPPWPALPMSIDSHLPANPECCVIAKRLLDQLGEKMRQIPETTPLVSEDHHLTSLFRRSGCLYQSWPGQLGRHIEPNDEASIWLGVHSENFQALGGLAWHVEEWFRWVLQIHWVFLYTLWSQGCSDGDKVWNTYKSNWIWVHNTIPWTCSKNSWSQFYDKDSHPWLYWSKSQKIMMLSMWTRLMRCHSKLVWGRQHPLRLTTHH